MMKEKPIGVLFLQTEVTMASLALMVAIIFFSAIFLGPISLLLDKLNFKILARIVALSAILVGGYWITVAPFPVSIIGVIGLIAGISVFRKR